MGSAEPFTLGAMFKKTKDQFPNQPALAYEVADTEGWTKVTYTKYYDLCIKAAKSFLKVWDLSLSIMAGMLLMVLS